MRRHSSGDVAPLGREEGGHACVLKRTSARKHGLCPWGSTRNRVGHPTDLRLTQRKKKSKRSMNAEQTRLEETRTKRAPWKKWGPYLSERQRGTVCEDYSESGDA
jgi:hypothetical protein